ncbi:MAG: caspase family protein [Sulfuritalea sp.]|jgi:WD40 repeat protein|nr:caspase family protein [Sulfuritalea sp.]
MNLIQLARLALLCGKACVAVLSFSAIAVLAAPTLPKDPVLRIETGSHLGLISRIGADASGRWIVTASEDKTARLWDARSGQAISVMRPPIGAESLGAVYAVAISPDGRTVALGGNSAFDGGGHLIHLFDRTSASVPPKSTLSGMEAPITQLAWSRDNQYLAIGLRQQGLRVFRRNLQFVGADPEFNEAVFGAEFAANGRLAVASIDGAIRIYQIGRNGLERIARKQAPGGKPYSVSFSADGRTLAVGYQDQARVDLLDANSLTLVHSIELKGGNLGRVVWSADGNTLFAAGSHVSGGRFPVLAFDQNGRGAKREIGQFSNTVMALASLPDGSVAAASAEPAWAVFHPQGKTQSTSRSQGADFRDAGDSFRLSPTAETVAFHFSAEAGAMVFDLAAGSLKSGSPPDKASPARISGNSGDWKNSTAPRFNGRALPMKPGEVARSLAMAPNERSFVLGSEWFLRHFSAEGVMLWERRVSAAAWAVNISADGRWVVAGLGDGSVRWLRLNDGAEQMALFVHADRERWIVWTPSGYYDTSVGGENLVGWHLNRAFNQSADFFSAGRFRDRLYRPDVIQKLLATGGEMEALRLAQADLAALEAANAEPPVPVTVQTQAKGRKPTSAGSAASAPPKLVELVPPIIELQSDSQVEAVGDLVKVRYAVRTPPDAPIRDIKVRVNGRLDRSIKPVSQRGVQGEIAVQEVQVRVPPGKDAEILLIAENRNAKSDPVSIKVSRVTAAKMPSARDKADFETLYMLVVAINKYPAPNDLSSPVKDANDFKSQMARIANPPAGVRKIYNKLEFKMLTDERATREAIVEGLNWLKTNVKEKDAGVLFLAGHGIAQDKSYYYIPFKPDGMAMKPAEWLPGDQIVGTLQSLPGRAMFFLDTCYAGALTNQASSHASNATDMINKIDDERGVIIFASSTGKEKSGESEENGFFTQALIEGLRGEAVDKKDNLVYPTLLKRYVTRRVKELSENKQRPFISDHGIDEPIAIVVK